MTTTTKTTVPLVLAALALSACGGGATTTPLTPVQKAQGHVDHILADPLAVPATEAMPVSGEALYTGSFGMQSAIDTSGAIVGDALIDVNFATGQMSGGAENFIYAAVTEEGLVPEAAPVAGTATFQGNFAGNAGLMEVTGSAFGETFEGGMLTSFTGENADNLIGLGAGDLGGDPVNFFLNVQK